MPRSLFMLAVVVTLSGCGGAPRRVGLVDVRRVVDDWPAAKRVSDRIESDRRSLVAAGAVLDAQAQAAGAARLDARATLLADRVLARVRVEAKDLARERGLRLIVTREFTGYGGDDVTEEIVRKIRAEGAGADAALTANLTTETP